MLFTRSSLKHLAILFQNRLDAIDIEKAVEFVIKCMNFDGAFGSKPGSESHAGLVYCCIGLLSITGMQYIQLLYGMLPETTKYSSNCSFFDQFLEIIFS